MLLPRLPSLVLARGAKRWADKAKPAYSRRFRNPVQEVAGMKALGPEKTDHIYDLKPHKMRVVQYNRYRWCGCGLARTDQPLCDLTCKSLNMKKLVKAGPVEYIAPETMDVWFCNCKQTNNRPFCDGSHRSDEVQNHRFDHRPQFWEPRGRKSTTTEQD
jgi:CDGSH-type Zn-finger protein